MNIHTQYKLLLKLKLAIEAYHDDFRFGFRCDDGINYGETELVVHVTDGSDTFEGKTPGAAIREMLRSWRKAKVNLKEDYRRDVEAHDDIRDQLQNMTDAMRLMREFVRDEALRAEYWKSARGTR